MTSIGLAEIFGVGDMKWKNVVTCGLFVVSEMYMYATQACSGGTERIISERTSGEHVGSDDMVVTGDFDGTDKLDRGYFAWSGARVGDGFSLCISMNEGSQEIKLLDFEAEPRNEGIHLPSCPDPRTPAFAGITEE